MASPSDRPVGDRAATPGELEPPKAVTPWLTTREATAYLRLPTVRALYKRVERSQVKAHRGLGRQLRFKRSELDAIVRGIEP